MSVNQAVELDPFDQWFALDSGFRIVAASTSQGRVEAQVGKIIWDAFPGSLETYGDFYRDAWREPQETIAFHFGHLVRVHAEVREGLLSVRYRRLVAVDTTTWTSLRRSVDLMDAILEEEAARSGPSARATLRLV